MDTHPLPSPPVPSQAGGGELQGPNQWEGGGRSYGAAVIVLSEAKGPVRANSAGPEPGQRGSTQHGRPMGSAAQIIFRDEQCAAPCPDNPHGKGQFGLWLCPPPRRRLERGAQPSHADGWPRCEAPQPGPEPTPSASLKDTAVHLSPARKWPASKARAARTQREPAPPGGSGGDRAVALSPRAGACDRRGRGPGSRGGSPR